ncbi:MAG: DUF4340 domain-containing protein [Myxococcota bacterium]
MTENRLLLVLLTVAIAASAWTLTRDETQPLQTVTLSDRTLAGVDRIVYESSTSTVTFLRKLDDFGAYWWVETEGKTPRNFVASSDGEALIERLLPFQAARSLGAELNDRLDEIELDPPAARLVLEGDSGGEAFMVGSQTQNNRGNRYVMRKGGSEVFLVDHALLRDLASPYRFRLRTFRTAERESVARASVVMGDVEFEAIQQNRQRPVDAFWASSRDPGTRADAVHEMLEFVERLGPSAPLTPPPSPADGPSLLTVEWLADDDDGLGRLEIRSESDGDVIARSSDTRTWVSVSPSSGTELKRLIEDAKASVR